MKRTMQGRTLGRRGQHAARTAALALLAGTLAVGGPGAAAASAAAAPLAAAVTVTSQAPVTGKVGAAYRYDLVTSAGAARWAVVSGSLPAGLTLDPAGVLRGTPTTAGVSTVVLRATTASGTVDASYTLVVRPVTGASPVVVSPPSGPAAGGTTVRVAVPGAAWKRVEAGTRSAVGLADDGSVWAWGHRAQAGTPGAARSLPVRVALSLPAGVRATTVGAGPWLSLAAASDGSVWSWGAGHAGDGSGSRELPAPTRVALTLPAGVRVVSVDAGAYHTVAVASDGSVWSWGENWLGQLGDGTLTDRTRPVRVPLPTGVRATQVVVGNNTTHVLATDGSVWGWGVNQGAIGDGTTADRTRPVRVTVPVAAGARVVQLASGAGFAHALSSDGSVLGWGWNIAGQVGDGTTVDRLAPVRVALPAGVRLSGVGSGWDHGLGIGTDGRVWWWGRVDCRDGDGYCGRDWDGGAKNLAPVPHAVALPTGSKPVAVDGGEWSSLVVGADGSLSGWGDNDFGQLADGTTTRRDVAVLSRSPLTVLGVKIGYTNGTGLKRLGPSAVSVVTPPRAPGVVDVTLRTAQANGTAGPWIRLSGAWTYTP